MKAIKFYSEYDIASGMEVKKIIEKINKGDIESEWDITDLLDFYNVLKYIGVKQFYDYIVQKTNIDLKTYEKKIKRKMGEFIGYNKDNYINFFDEIDFESRHDFLEIIESYKLYKKNETTEFVQLIEEENLYIYEVLKFKRLTVHYDEPIKDLILSDSKNAEMIISKYLNEDDLYLPSSLTEEDKLSLIDKYINSPLVKINVLRKIVNFPSNTGLSITDKIKLSAKRKADEQEEELFKGSRGIESGVMISYQRGQDEAVLINMNGRTAEIKISKNWIEDNLDYPTLWNNFIYLFGYVDGKARLELDFKRSESGTLESLIRPKASHLYSESTSFYFKEMLSHAQIYSYNSELNIHGVRLEEMIEWFFDVYIKAEFQINDYIVKMPSSKASYFEKCRTILPEIDRVFKQYNTLIEDGSIDQELIQMSSSSFKNKDIKSFNGKKYVYSNSDWYKTGSFLLFSDQSSIFYLPNKEKKHENFYTLMSYEKLTTSDFREHQLKRMQWLFDNNLIRVNEMGYFEFVDQRVIFILKELYYKEVLSYWHYSKDVQVLIEELSVRNIVEFNSSLFSRNEQDYIDYYLNKSKFTNGHDIRNKYLHGTNTNDEKQYKEDYYSILKLLVIIIIKINDDLCIKYNNDNSL